MRVPALLLALALGAAPAAAAPMSLSYDEAMQLAVDANPTLLQSQLDADSAEGAVLQAKSAFDPVLTGDGNFASSRDEQFTQFGTLYTDVNSTSWGTSLSQFSPTGTSLNLSLDASRSVTSFDLPDVDPAVAAAFLSEIGDGQIQYRNQLGLSVTQSLLQGHRFASNMQAVRQAVRGLDMADATVLQQRQQTMADTASAYWGLWYQNELVRIAETSLGVAKEEQRIVDAQVDAGELAPVEGARVAAAVIQAEQAVLDARIARDTAADGLLLLLGAQPGQAVELKSQPQTPTLSPVDPDAAVNAAMAGNYSLQVARLTEENAKAALADARHRRLPELSATGSMTLNGFEEEQGAAWNEMLSAELPVWFLGANLTAPLGNRADRGSVLSAQAEAAKARSQRENLERTISQQVRAQVRTIESAATRLRLAEANLALAEQTLAADRALREAGRAIERDVLTSLKDLDNARVEQQKALSDFQLALIELSRLQGRL